MWSTRLPGGRMRRRFSWDNGRGTFLSAEGVEFALVVALVLLKLMNLVQLIVSVLFDGGGSRREWLEYAAAGLFAAAGGAPADGCSSQSTSSVVGGCG
jgi:hypothetical protein